MGKGKEGNSNSKCFHRVANIRKNMKFIKSLVNEKGEIKRLFEKLNSKPPRDSLR